MNDIILCIVSSVDPLTRFQVFCCFTLGGMICIVTRTSSLLYDNVSGSKCDDCLAPLMEQLELMGKWKKLICEIFRYITIVMKACL